MAKIQGRRVKELHEGGGDLWVSAVLNTHDREAARANQGKADPILLRDVIRSDGKAGSWPNAIIVDAGSVIEFKIRSKGAFGYGLRLETDHEVIVEEFYRPDKDGSGKFLDVSIRRYQHTEQTIRVDDFKTLGAVTPDKKNKYWSCRIMTWPLLGFKQGLRSYGNPRELVNAEVMGGGLHEGPQSDTTFDKITRVRADENERNGYIAIWFFVFKDPAAKKQFFTEFADPDPEDF